MRHQRREEAEHTIEVQLPAGVRRRHRAGISAWGLDQTRQPQLGLVCVMERSGFSVTTERTRGENTTRLQQACVVCLDFPPPYALLLVRWKVDGRDL